MNDSAVTHDILLARCDGSTKAFRIYGRPLPEIGQIITLPAESRFIKARVLASSPRAEAVELVESSVLEVL